MQSPLARERKRGRASRLPTQAEQAPLLGQDEADLGLHVRKGEKGKAGWSSCRTGQGEAELGLCQHKRKERGKQAGWPPRPEACLGCGEKRKETWVGSVAVLKRRKRRKV